MMCTYDHQGADYGSTVFFISLGFGFPWIVTVYAYMRIFLFVRSKRKALLKSQAEGNMTVSGSKHKLGISTSDINLLRSTFTIFVLFFVMWAPYALIVLFDPPHTWPTQIYVIAGLFAHTNSSINSILYAVTNKNFRDGYLKILRCGIRGARVATENSTVITATADTNREKPSQEEAAPVIATTIGNTKTITFHR